MWTLQNQRYGARYSELVCEYFYVLRRAMIGYLKKGRYGILAAAQQDFYSDFELQLAKIRKAAEGIHRPAQLGLFGV